MSISSIGGATSQPYPTGYSGPGRSGGSTPGSSVADKFLEYARMTPAERFREDLLNSMGLTEEDVQKMSGEDRKAIEDEITRRIKEKIEQDSQQKAGFFTDIKA